MKFNRNELERSELITEVRQLLHRRYDLLLDDLMFDPTQDPNQTRIHLSIQDYLRPTFDWWKVECEENNLDQTIDGMLAELSLADERKKSPARILKKIAELSASARASYEREILYGHCLDVINEPPTNPVNLQVVTRLLPLRELRHASNDRIQQASGNIYSTFQARVLDDLDILEKYFSAVTPNPQHLRYPLYQLLLPYKL